MKNFEATLNQITNPAHKELVTTLLQWICDTYPDFETVVKWNQPMFSHHGTFIISLSISKNHYSINPEAHCISIFEDLIREKGYSFTENIVRFHWDQPIDYDLIKEFIDFNVVDKRDTKTFWR